MLLKRLWSWWHKKKLRLTVSVPLVQSRKGTVLQVINDMSEHIRPSPPRSSNISTSRVSGKPQP